MLSSIRHIAGLVVLFIITSPAHAHFIFVSIGPFAEGGRYAEVYFSAEAEAGDPHFVEKIKQKSGLVQNIITFLFGNVRSSSLERILISAETFISGLFFAA